MLDPIDSNRLEELLAGDPGSSPDERAVATLVADLRAGRAGAPPGLEQRVAAIAAARPKPRRRVLALRRPRQLGRAALVLAPAALAIVLGIAVLRGLVSSASSPTPTGRTELAPATRSAGAGKATDSAAPLAIAGSAVNGSSPVPPTRGRAQSY